jgi:hypothetical protein
VNSKLFPYNGLAVILSCPVNSLNNPTFISSPSSGSWKINTLTPFVFANSGDAADELVFLLVKNETLHVVA